MSSEVTNIIVSGAMGRMGQAILRLAAQDRRFRIVGGVESADSVEKSGGALAVAAGRIPLAASLSDLQPDSSAAVIEFTTPEATRSHVEQVAQLGLKMVVGTTGLSADTREAVASAGEKTAVLLAPNMSLGINVLVGIVSKLAGALAEYDIEVAEMHHRHKKDAPSGTAIALAEAAASGRSRKLEEIVRHGRQGLVGERSAGEIGMHALRGGDVVGEHTVYFAGEGERLELTHRVQNRDTFALGALRAAQYLAGQEKGLFTMQDVLGI